MTPTRRLHALALAAVTLCAAPLAHASGGGGGEPTDELVTRGGADYDRDQLLHGHVGIVLPTWNSESQYLAWRGIVTNGKVAFKLAAPAQAASDVPAGWTDAAKPDVAASAGAGGAPTFASRYDRPNCSPDAASFAALTYEALQARPDRTKARVDAWAAAQAQVFELCSRDPLEVLEAPDPLVAPLPASEPLYWRQLRDYQMAAAAFYAAHYAQSQQAFERIGRTPGHPMQPWGAYLALRSHLRAVQLKPAAALQANPAGPTPAPPEQVQDLQALRKEAALILRDNALESVHEATAATLRRAAFLLAPGHHFAELSNLLDDLKADPTLDDTLDDWQLVGYATGDAAADARTLAALRAAHPWYDWMMSISHGEAPPTPATAASGVDLHASQAWTRSLGAAGHAPGDVDAGLHRAWLVAALMSDAPLTAGMEREALGVTGQAPELPSVRYYLAERLAVAPGRAEQARAMSDGLLERLRKTQPLSSSAVNLVTQQRFRLATDVRDAGTYLLMDPVASVNPDTGERDAPVGTRLQPSFDGLRWLDRSLAVSDLLVLARSLKTPTPWRARIAVAAWLRADFLGDTAAALDASTLVEQLAPALKPVTTHYRALATAPERQHWLILSALRRGLTPDVQAYNRDVDNTWPVNKPEDTVADLWCHVGLDVNDDYAAAVAPGKKPERLEPPEVTADPAQRNAERARLLKIHTATGFVGLHAIEWAASHPTDKDLPWLLYVAVQSSRGGCVDPDHTAISKKAWQILHKQFPRSPWTADTPYFY